jgi:hypothetical protein
MDYSAQLHYPGNPTKKSQKKRFTNKRIKKEINNVEKTHQTNYSENGMDSYLMVMKCVI